MRVMPLLVLLVSFGGSAAMANCVPPYSTMFACDLMDDGGRVEFCERIPDGGGFPDRFSYNFVRAHFRSELYFEAEDNYGSAKYYRTDDRPIQTVGTGLLHGEYVYSVFLTGPMNEHPDVAQIHVYKTLKDFQDNKESDIERLYCDESSIIINWDHFGPG